jgi:group I intron endonuclease
MDNNAFKNAKIYKLTNTVDDEIYIGSTSSTLQRRLSTHKANAKVHTQRPIYQHLNKVGMNNVSIELIEDFPCDNKVQLEVREQHWVNTLKPTLNSRKP